MCRMSRDLGWSAVVRRFGALLRNARRAVDKQFVLPRYENRASSDVSASSFPPFRSSPPAPPPPLGALVRPFPLEPRPLAVVRETDLAKREKRERKA